MKRIFAAVGLALLLVASGCGSSGGSGSAKAITSLAGLRSTLRKAKITCEAPAPYEAPDDEASATTVGPTVAVDPDEQMTCRSDGATVELFRWADDATAEASIGARLPATCGAKTTAFDYVSGGNWFAVARPGRSDDDVTAANRRLAAAAEGSLLQYRCGARPTSTTSVGTSTPTSTTTTAPKGPGHRRTSPLALGTAARIGAYKVRVTLVARDATAQVQGEDGVPAKNGRYVLVAYDATYTGTGQGDPAVELDLALAGGDGKVYSGCDAAYGDDVGIPVLAPGATTTIRHCLDVPVAPIEGGAISISDALAPESAPTYWVIP